MDIRTEKLRLIELLLNTDNPIILKKIQSIFQSEEDQDFWDRLRPDQQREIDLAIKEVNEGQTIPLNEVLDKHR